MTDTTPAARPGADAEGDGEPWIGYIRVSTWKEEKISPEIQEAALRQWAAHTGRRLLEPLTEDLDASGRNFNRKIMRDIERVERGEARGIAVWRYSRFGRNRTGNAVNLARLENVGGHLESATEPVDATTAIGRFQRGMILEFGNYESDRAGEQWRETHDHRRDKEHLPATGRRRFGYIWHRRWNPRTETLQRERYTFDPATAPYVRELYVRQVEGEGFTSLCAWLNGAGWRTTTGRMWEQSALRKYMDSGFPAGLLRIHDPECRCTRMASCARWLYRPGAQPAIVDKDLWARYLAHREVVKATPPRARVATYTLTGLMRHGDCRRGMGAFRGGSTGQTVNGYGYRCTWALKSGGSTCPGVSITRAAAEAAVLDWLATEAAPGVDAAPAAPPRRHQVADARAAAARERARLGAEIAKFDAGLARLQADRAVNPDDYPPGAYEAARDRIKAQRATAAAALDRVAEVETAPDRTDYEPLVVGLLAEWETLTVAERNGILRQLLRRVVVYRVDRGIGRRARSRVEVHPVWEPDPWEDGSELPVT